MGVGARIDYIILRQLTPEADRKAALPYLKTNGGNQVEVAKFFGVKRTVVYDILKKAWERSARSPQDTQILVKQNIPLGWANSDSCTKQDSLVHLWGFLLTFCFISSYI